MPLASSQGSVVGAALSFSSLLRASALCFGRGARGSGRPLVRRCEGRSGVWAPQSRAAVGLAGGAGGWLHRRSVFAAARPAMASATDASGRDSGSSAPAGDPAQHVNRLAKQQSPYLLQHAHNPVDWYPWGEEAFAKARSERKPIFLSVGYSTCHWCHVMEHESFESEAVADIMNRFFVNIKVDREERPDVDKVYMTYVQATQGGGGWPMSVFLTPSLQPFLGGTYFPPEDAYGRPGFKTLLQRVAQVWHAKAPEIQAGGEQALQAIAQLAEATSTVSTSETLSESFAEEAVANCCRQLDERFDPKEGGFGTAPKFPRPSELNVLMRYHVKRKSSHDAKGKATATTKHTPLHMALLSLNKMAAGGIHDHIGGGFHRYSVDEYWHVPHFEKMMYDQGQLACAYLDAYTIVKEDRFAIMAQDILDYILRDMTAPNGGIYSAEDADSAPEGGGPKKEGLFYLWTAQEINEVLGSGPAAQIFSAHYAITEAGNCNLSAQSDPHREFVGMNVPIVRGSVEQTAAQFGMSEERCQQLLAECREVLHKRRGMRPHPHLDDKIITAWNGLAISALSRASRILRTMQQPAVQRSFPVEGRDPKDYLTAATRAALFIRDSMYDSRTGVLYRSFRESLSSTPGFLDDYACLIMGLLDLYEGTGNTDWVDWALRLQVTQDQLFWDASGGGYFNTASGDPSILLRMKEDYDGAEPSGNSIAAVNLLRFAAMFGMQVTDGMSFQARAEQTMALCEGRLKDVPLALPQMCCALLQLASPTKRQIVVVGSPQDEGVLALLDAAHSVFEPDRSIIVVDTAHEPTVNFWKERNPHVISMAKQVDGQATAYVCQNFACQAPVTSPDKLRRLLVQAGGTPSVQAFDVSDITS
eukprot:jgi/Chlat1/3975/Chrsp26S04040